MRKSRSILLNLPEEQQAKLAEWLLSGMTYHEALELIGKPPPDGFGCKVRSLSAFKPFWEEVCVPHLVRKRNLAVSTAAAVAEEASKTPGRFDQATIDQLQQKAFELSISPNASPKDVKALFMLVLKAKDQDLQLQQLSLDREKFQFDAAKACLKQLPQLRAIAAAPAINETDKIQAVRKLLFGTLPA